MADLQALVERTRMELADQGKFFTETLRTTGDVNVYGLSYAPVNAQSCRIMLGEHEVPDFPDPDVEYSGVQIEEATGKLIFDFYPPEGMDLHVSGVHYRYFTDAELSRIVETSLGMHTHNRADSFGRAITLSRLDPMEEYPLALLSTINALYVILTDASFDIDIYAPDGINIPRSQRHRQLLELIDTLQRRYAELSALLGIGLYAVQIFTLRRISHRTGRYVPVYRPMEIDDRGRPERVYLPLPTYGGEVIDDGIPDLDLIINQGDTFTQAATVERDIPENAVLTAQIRGYAGSPVIAAEFKVTRLGPHEVVLSLPNDETRDLPRRSVWDLQMVVPHAGLTEEFGDEFDTREGASVTLLRGNITSPREVTTDTSRPPREPIHGLTTQVYPHVETTGLVRNPNTFWVEQGGVP